VLALLGAFYVLPALYGALGRLYVPELLMTGSTDAVVLSLPVAALSGPAGPLLQALLVAGAFAAFLSTSSGLLVTTAGVVAQDLLPAPRGERARGDLPGTRAGVGPRLPARDVPDRAALAGARPAGRTLPLTQVVGLAFAVAASTFCPLLLLGHLVARPHGDRRRGRAARGRRACRRSPSPPPSPEPCRPAGRRRCSPSRRPGRCPPPSPSWSSARC
jgi:hypothetical protein